LDDNCCYNYHNEEGVVEEVLKCVELFIFKFTSVDFVEDLQEDKYIEEDGVVLACLVVPVCHPNRGGNSKHFRT
jgi:hypothetical protein